MHLFASFQLDMQAYLKQARQVFGASPSELTVNHVASTFME